MLKRAGNMGKSLFLLALLGIYEASAQFVWVQPNHLDLTQQAGLLCALNGTSMRLTFTLDVANDTVAGVFTRNNSDPTQNSVGNFDTFGPNGISGTGTTADPYTFDLFIDCGTNPPTLDPLDEQDKLLYTEGTDSASIRVVSKSIWVPAFMDMFNFYKDVVYRASCNCSNVQSAVLTTGEITVIGGLEEDLVATVEDARLVVYDSTLNLETLFIDLGDPIFLAIVPEVNTQSVGAFVFDCSVCDTSTCTGGLVAVPFIGPDGCSTIPSYFSSFDLIGGLIRTQAFNSFQLNGQISLYFQCSVGFCYDALDTRCPDYCGFSGRKKRQAVQPETETVHVVTKLTIRSDGSLTIEGPDGPVVGNTSNAPEPAQETQTVALIAVLITLAGLLLIGVIVAFAVFIRRSRRNSRNEKIMK